MDKDKLEEELEFNEFFNAMDEQDCFFLPTREDCNDIIVKVGSEYYLWLENENLMLLTPTVLELEEDEEDHLDND